MQVFAYKMCNFLKKVFQCPPDLSDFSVHSSFMGIEEGLLRTSYICPWNLALVFRIVLVTAEFPQESVHRGLAVRGILLCCESSLVGRDLHEVFRTCCDSQTHCCETIADLCFVRAHRGRTFSLATEVDSITMVARSSCYAMRTKEHFVARMLSALTGF